MTYEIFCYFNQSHFASWFGVSRNLTWSCGINLCTIRDFQTHIEVTERSESMKMRSSACLLLLAAVCIAQISALRNDDCEVCIKVIQRFADSITESVKKEPKLIEAEFRKFCRDLRGKENRFCYYLGGLEESATGILGEVSKPLSWSMPPDKICEKLKKKDAQICDLRYDKTIDLKTVELKKLKVRDLKKILNDWDEECEGCLEKTDFINRIEELKPKYMREEL